MTNTEKISKELRRLITVENANFRHIERDGKITRKTLQNFLYGRDSSKLSTLDLIAESIGYEIKVEVVRKISKA